jgi:hypothetical protein
MVVKVPLQKQIEPHECEKAKNLNILVAHTLEELQMDGGARRLDGDAVVKAFAEQTPEHDFKIAYICAHKVIAGKPKAEAEVDQLEELEPSSALVEVDEQQQESFRPLSLVRIGLADGKAAPLAAFKGALAVLGHLQTIASGTFAPGGVTDPRKLNKDADMVYLYKRQVSS